MDQKMRDAVIDSAERAAQLAMKVEDTTAPFVQIGRSTLRLLLAEHAFLCGFVLGAIDKENSRP